MPAIDPTASPTLCALELIDVPAGLCALDALVKQAEVDIYFAGDIDPGRFLIVFGGDLAACESALAHASAGAGREVVESLLLPFAHLRLRAALLGEFAEADAESQRALGIMQCHSPIATLAAVDRALKAAEVEIVRLRFASELAGQGHSVVRGDQHDVEAALHAAETGALPGVVVRTRRIARPAPEVVTAAAQRPFGVRALRPLDP
ncbi:MAG: BMC domain-containing protein [Deltaproteobacteria bacterium]|nr:BMC domain-containing protein [Deltaproteobacteria bacterium]